MIKLNNLNKSFDDTLIYENVNYEFKEKKLTCFLGPSGSGKTTLLNVIAGFDTNYDGDIIVEGRKLKNLSLNELCKYRFNNIGFIFQNYHLLKGYTAIENVLMGVNLNNDIAEGEKDKRAGELLERLGLEEQRNQKIETLSGGQKQRVAIARALINEPDIILADEPTGALDGESTKIIIEILKDISKTKSVIIITHDEEVAEYADEIIELEDYKIIVKKNNDTMQDVAVTEEAIKENKEPKLLKGISRALSIKNFKIHLFKYIIAAIIIAFASAAFVGSLATKDITNNLISDFKNKNSFYNVGQVPIYDNGQKVNEDIGSVYNTLSNDERFENVYYQYDLENIKLINGEKSIEIQSKVPTALPKESMSYGNMPRDGYKEVAISSSVANRLTNDIKNIIGEEIVFELLIADNEVEEITLKVSGLTNSQYQDFIISSDLEKELYEKVKVDKENPTAISFTIVDFEKIPSIDEELKDKEIGVYTKAKEVQAFTDSFTSLINLYTVFSYLILVVGVIISGAILYKVSSERYSEIGLLGALGYTKSNVKRILGMESIIFASISTCISFLLIVFLNMFYKLQFGYGVSLSISNLAILVVINLTLAIGLSYIINLKLINTEPAEALRKN